jgi:hypothetical protein
MMLQTRHCVVTKATCTSMHAWSTWDSHRDLWCKYWQANARDIIIGHAQPESYASSGRLRGQFVFDPQLRVSSFSMP